MNRGCRSADEKPTSAVCLIHSRHNTDGIVAGKSMSRQKTNDYCQFLWCGSLMCWTSAE